MVVLIQISMVIKTPQRFGRVPAGRLT